MKKSKIAKLKLQATTVLKLDNKNLTQVAGGYAPNGPKDSNSNMWTCEGCAIL